MARSSKWTKITKEAISERQLVVKDLAGGSEYAFRVSAVNIAGVSKPSDASATFVAKVCFC